MFDDITLRKKWNNFKLQAKKRKNLKIKKKKKKKKDLYVVLSILGDPSKTI